MTDYNASLYNLLIGGEDWTILGTKRIRNVINLKLGGFDFQLQQNPNLKPSWGNYKGQTIQTTNLIIPNLDPNKFADAENLSHNVVELLSFATGSEGVYAEWHFPHPSRTTTGQFHSFVGAIEFFRPALETGDGAVVRSFLEQTFDNYVQQRASRQLNIVVHYYTLSQKSLLPLELHLITSFTLLENLKHTFAINNPKTYPFLNNRFWPAGTTLALIKKKKARSLGFKNLLEDMLKAVGMTPIPSASIDSIIALRNEIIHSGLSSKPYKELWSLYETAQDVIREYLLRLFGYHGNYFPFSKTNQPQKI